MFPQVEFSPDTASNKVVVPSKNSIDSDSEGEHQPIGVDGDAGDFEFQQPVKGYQTSKGGKNVSDPESAWRNTDVPSPAGGRGHEEVVALRQLFSDLGIRYVCIYMYVY
jgi:hypothetical protein